MTAYGTDHGFAEWLIEQGYDLKADGPWQDALRARGSAYVDGYEQYWTGHRTNEVWQDRAWPRSGAKLNCTVDIPDDVVPIAIITATYRAAWLESQTPGILAGAATAPGKRVKRNKVEGAVEREYFDDGKAAVGSGPAFIDSIIDGALRQFACTEQPGGTAFMWSLGS